MEVRAKLKNAPMGARKARYVAALVRNRSCAEALSILHASPRAAARPLEKLIRSALANAEERNARQQAGLDVDNLFIKTILVDQASHNWRIRARARGSAAWIRKQSSHLEVVLDER